MNNKKIVFFDIDGTIYSYGKSVPDDTKEAIRQLRKNGHYAVICTGRTKSMIFPQISEVGFDGLIGGAGTYVEFQDRVLHEYHLPKAISDEIIKDMRKNDIFAIPEGIDNIYFDVEKMPESYRYIYNTYIENVREHVKDIGNRSDITVSKLSGRFNDESKIEGFIKKYEKDFNIVFHAKYYIEMIPKNYSKAVGIERLISELQIPLRNTYAFGDGMNDYEMLNYVNYPVAMGNATEEFKSLIGCVTDDYDKGGISNALKRFGLI
ncbi:MAG: Cof-type HAD-IIB family hydrolase [Lachnospiraceae bacterium]|nr:Cof-type HAD-IIB family hydrolase [Lachnospiraceae bacterium]